METGDKIICPNCKEDYEIAVEYIGSGRVEKVDKNKVLVNSPYMEPSNFFCSVCEEEWDFEPEHIICNY